MNLDHLTDLAIALIATAIFASGYATGASKATRASLSPAYETRALRDACRDVLSTAERTAYLTLAVQETLRAMQEEREDAAEVWEVDR